MATRSFQYEVKMSETSVEIQRAYLRQLFGIDPAQMMALEIFDGLGAVESHLFEQSFNLLLWGYFNTGSRIMDFLLDTKNLSLKFKAGHINLQALETGLQKIIEKHTSR